MDNKKLIGQLSLNLDTLRKDVTQANTILKGLTEIKVNAVDVNSGKESIAILRQLEGEFKKLKDASGKSFDTAIFKQMEKALKDLGVSYGTVIQKVTEYKKEFKNEDGTSELRVWKEKTNAINENGKAIEKVKKILADGTEKHSSATVIDNSAKERTLAYADSIAKVSTEYKKMEATNTLSINGIKTLKSELTKIQQSYKLTAAEAKALWTEQAKFTNKINTLSNPKSTTTQDIVPKNEIATVQTMYNEMKRENATSVSNLKILSTMLEDVRKKYALNTTDVNKLTGMQARYTAEINTQVAAENRKNEAQNKNSGKNTTQYNAGYKSQLDGINQSYLTLNSSEKARISDLNALASRTTALVSGLGLEGNARNQATTQAKKYTDEAKRVQTAIDQEVKARQDATAKIIAANERQSLSALKLYTQEKANSQEYSKMSTQLSKISGEKQLAMGSGDYSNGLMDRVKISAAYSFAAANIYILRNSIKELITTNTNYEQSLMDLSRTLDNVTNNDLKAYGKQAVAYSKEFGQPLKEVQNAMTELARAGVNNKSDLTGMSKSVMLGLNTTEITSATEMTGYLVSAVKQLGMSFQDSEKIIDGWNKLGDKYAVKSNDMAEAMQRAGSSSKALGIDLNNLNAITVVIGEATQKSGSEVGNAIKTMETRLLRPETIKVLESYGISIMKDAEHFNSFKEIMTGVNSALDNFGEGTKSSNDILDSIGGAWRKNDISVLAKGWDQIDAIAKESADSVGYSAKENEKAMNTYAKQLEVFKSSIKELYLSIGEAGLMTSLKGIVDGTTSITQALAKADPGMKKFLFTLLEVGVAVKSLSSLNKIVTGLNFTQILDKTGINSFSALVGGYSKSTTAAKAYQAASASLAAQVASGSITATESAGILQVVGTKLGLASTSTNVLSAAQTGLQASLTSGIALEASLTSQVTAGTLSEQGRKAELLQRMFTEKELQAQQASGIITSEEYNLALRRRSVYEAGLQSQVNAGTMTQAQADILLKEKIITQEQYNLVIAQTSSSLNVSTASTAGQTASNEALNASQKAVTIGAWAMKAAMLAGVLVITFAITAIVKHVQAQKNAVQDMQSALDSINNKTSSIDGLINEHAELAKKTSLTAEETKRYGEVVKELNKLLPDSSSIIKDQTLSIDAQTEAMKKNNAELDKASTKKSIKDAVGNYDKSKNNALSQKSIYDNASQVAKGVGEAYDKAYAIKKAEYIAQMGAKGELLKQDLTNINTFVLEEANKTRDEAYNSMTKSKEIVSVYSAWFKKLAEDGVLAAGITGKVATEVINAFDKMGESKDVNKDKIINYSNSLVELGKEDVFKKFSASVEEFNKKASHTPEEIAKQKSAIESLFKGQKSSMPTAEYELFNKILTEVINNMAKAGEIASTASFSSEAFKIKMKDLDDAFKETQTSVGNLNSVISEMSKGNTLSTEEMSDLILKYPQLTDKVEGSAGAYTIQVSALKDVRQASIDAMKTTMESEKTNALNTLNGVASQLKSYGVLITAIKDVASAKLEASKIEIYSLPEGVQGPVDNAESTKKKQSDIDAINAYGLIQDKIKGLTSVLNDNTLGVKKDTSATKELTEAEKQAIAEQKRLTQATKEANNAIKDQEIVLKSLNNQLKQQDISMGKMEEHSAKYRKGIEAKIALLKQEESVTGKYIVTNTANAKSLENLANVANRANVKANNAKASGSSGSISGSNSDVRVNSGVTASQLNAKLQGTLAGHGADYISAGKQYGIDPAFLSAITMHETGRGTNAGSREKNNVGGMMKTSNVQMSFSSIEAGINAMAKLLAGSTYIKGGAVTPSAIQNIYCEVGADNDAGFNKDWLGGVTDFWKEFGGGGFTGGKSQIMSATGESNLDSGADSLLSKVEGFKDRLIDIKQEIDKLKIEKINNELGEKDDAIKNYEQYTTLNEAKSKQFEIGSKEYITAKKDELDAMRNKYIVITQKQELLNTSIKKGGFDERTTTGMKSQLADLNVQYLGIYNEIRDKIKETYTTAFEENDKLLVKFQDDAKKVDDSISLLGIIDNPEERQKQLDFMQTKKVINLSELRDITAETNKYNEELKTINKTTTEGQIRVKSITDRLKELGNKQIDVEVKLIADEESMKAIRIDSIGKEEERSLKPIEIKIKDIDNAEKMLNNNDMAAKTGLKVQKMTALSSQLDILTDSYRKLSDEIKSHNTGSEEDQNKLDTAKSKIVDMIQTLKESIASLESLKMDIILKPFENQLYKLNLDLERYNFLIKATENSNMATRVNLSTQALMNNKQQMTSLMVEAKKLTTMEMPKQEAYDKWKTNLESVKGKLISTAQAQIDLNKQIANMKVDTLITKLNKPEQQIDNVVSQIDMKLSMGDKNMGNLINTAFDNTQTVEESIDSTISQTNETVGIIDDTLKTSINSMDTIDMSVQDVTSQINESTNAISNLLNSINSSIDGLKSTIGSSMTQTGHTGTALAGSSSDPTSVNGIFKGAQIGDKYYTQSQLSDPKMLTEITGEIVKGGKIVEHFENGTNGTTEDEPAVVGDGKKDSNGSSRELAVLPSGETKIIGEKGWTLQHLPKGTKVIPHEETEKILRQGGITNHFAKGIGDIRHYANGTGMEYGNSYRTKEGYDVIEVKENNQKGTILKDSVFDKDSKNYNETVANSNGKISLGDLDHSSSNGMSDAYNSGKGTNSDYQKSQRDREESSNSPIRHVFNDDVASNSSNSNSISQETTVLNTLTKQRDVLKEKVSLAKDSNELYKQSIDLQSTQALIALKNIESLKTQRDENSNNKEIYDKITKEIDAQYKIIERTEKALKDLGKNRIDSMLTNADLKIKDITDSIKVMGKIDTENEMETNYQGLSNIFTNLNSQIKTLVDEETKINPELLNLENIKIAGTLTDEQKLRLIELHAEMDEIKSKKVDVTVEINSNIEAQIQSYNDYFSEMNKNVQDKISLVGSIDTEADKDKLMKYTKEISDALEFQRLILYAKVKAQEDILNSSTSTLSEKDTARKAKELLVTNQMQNEIDIVKNADDQHQQALDKINRRISEMDKALKLVDETSEDLQKKLTFIKDWNQTDYSSITSLQQSLYDNSLKKHDLSIKESQQIMKLRDNVKVGSEQWNVYNDKLKEVNNTTEDSIMQMQNQQKELLKTNFYKAYKNIESKIFDGSTSETEKEKLDAKAKYQGMYIEGEEKALAIDKLRTSLNSDIRNSVSETAKVQLNAQLIQLNLLEKQDKLTRVDYERFQKKLEIIKIEQQIENAKSQKIIQQLTQKSDGSYDWEYVADQDKIDSLNEDLKQKQVDMITWERDQELKKQQDDLSTKNDYLTELQKILDKAQNGQYKSQTDFQRALDALNAKFKMSGTDFDNNMNDIVNSYTVFTTNMVSLSSKLSEAITNSAKAIQDAVTTLQSAVDKLNTDSAKKISEVEEKPNNNNPAENTGSHSLSQSQLEGALAWNNNSSNNSTAYVDSTDGGLMYHLKTDTDVNPNYVLVTQDYINSINFRKKATKEQLESALAINNNVNSLSSAFMTTDGSIMYHLRSDNANIDPSYTLIDQAYVDANTASLITGGMTPSNIDDGAMAVLHSDEIINNPLQTKELLNTSSNLLALKNYMPSALKTIDTPRLSTKDVLPNYVLPPIHLPNNLSNSIKEVVDKINTNGVNNNSNNQPPQVINHYTIKELSVPNALTDIADLITMFDTLPEVTVQNINNMSVREAL